MRRSNSGWGKYQCGNPSILDGSVVCCEAARESDNAWRRELFGGERVDLNTAIERCNAPGGYFPAGQRLCNDPYIRWEDCEDPKQGGCDVYYTFYWLNGECAVKAKINRQGSVAIVHKHSVPNKEVETYRTYVHFVAVRGSFVLCCC
jgi:hypothetical protein